MPLTHFPQGVSSFGMPIIGMGEETMTTGNVFFVDSGHAQASDGNAGDDIARPMATIDAAIARCTANNGDIIFVMPGHDENPTASITMDVAGVWIRGLGWGSSRPTVTFGATAATVAMSAASTRISNIRFDLGTAAATVTAAFTITADSCMIENCETVPHATSQFTYHVLATDSQFVIVRNNRFRALHTASSRSGIVLDGCDDAVVVGNEVSGHFTDHALDNVTQSSSDEILRATIVGNILYNYSTTADDTAVHLDDSATGIMAYNMLSHGIEFSSGLDMGAMRMIENYMTDAADVSARLAPSALAT